MTNLTLDLVLVILLHMTNCRVPLVHKWIRVWGTDDFHHPLQVWINLLGDGDVRILPGYAPGWLALGVVIEVMFH